MISNVLDFLGLIDADIPDQLAFVVLSCFLVVGITEFFRLLDLLIDKATGGK